MHVLAYCVRALSSHDEGVRRASSYALHLLLQTHAPRHKFRELQEVWVKCGSCVGGWLLVGRDVLVRVCVSCVAGASGVRSLAGLSSLAYAYRLFATVPNG